MNKTIHQFEVDFKTWWQDRLRRFQKAKTITEAFNDSESDIVQLASFRSRYQDIIEFNPDYNFDLFTEGISDE
jgi:hypothetical protein